MQFPLQTTLAFDLANWPQPALDTPHAYGPREAATPGYCEGIIITHYHSSGLIMSTSIPLAGPVRDRLRTYGTAGMTYNEILTQLMDEVDRRAFIEETRRRLQRLRDKDLVDLEDVR